jgi:hypothetical protein
LGAIESPRPFYEQNNISAFKKMFLEQIEFAMKEYF